MTDYAKLLSKRFKIEQQLRALNNSQHLKESTQAKELANKLQHYLVQVNEELDSIGQSMYSIPEAHGHMDATTYNQEPDHEVQMARGELYRTARHAIMLHKMLQSLPEQNGLEGWVQSKITKAADYIETVWHYLSYEMRFPSENAVSEAVGIVRPYGPGEATGEDAPATPPSPSARSAKPYAGPGSSAPDSGIEPPEPGSQSPTPPSGGATPAPIEPGHVKMMRFGPGNVPLGAPITVPNSDVETKQKVGYKPIQETASNNSKVEKDKEEKKPRFKMTYCSQCGKGFGPGDHGFSHCVDHKGKKVVEEMASAGASSAGGIAGGFGNGFLNGGPGAITRYGKKKKKKTIESEKVDEASRMAIMKAAAKASAEKSGVIIPKPKKPEKKEILIRDNKEVPEGTMTDAEKDERGPKFTGYWKGTDKGRPGKKMVGGGT